MESHNPRLVFLIASSVLASLVLSASSRNYPCEFPAIFNFGDSNSDTGGRSAAFGNQLGPPYGQSYFHSPAGRFCDGRLIIDFIAEELGLPYLSPYLDALGPNFTHGANFATAGATIGPLSAIMQQAGFSPITLDVQINQFNDFHNRSQIIRENGGVFGKLMPKAEDFSRALYTFDIGQNDIYGGYFSNKTTDQIREFVPELIDQFKETIKKLYYDHGGRSFWVHGTGPLGCLPISLSTFLITASQIDEVGCASPANDVSQYYNHKLKEAVFQLRCELPDAAITYVDIYSIKYDLISHAKKYGFEQPLIACCGYGGKFNFDPNFYCSEKVKLHDIETIVGSCADPSVRVNWDGSHYTQAANHWFFERIMDGSYSDPPIPLEMACHSEMEMSLLAQAN